ncbi:hypothetical protein [Actinophytocola sp. NPDC049390]|uniref:hypothetical protein n=1 Tax=Actinophytocola sp. NPDC049390 TaxID=3363894 RepID=UPI0037B76D88
MTCANCGGTGPLRRELCATCEARSAWEALSASGRAEFDALLRGKKHIQAIAALRDHVTPRPSLPASVTLLDLRAAELAEDD